MRANENSLALEFSVMYWHERDRPPCRTLGMTNKKTETKEPMTENISLDSGKLARFLSEEISETSKELGEPAVLST